MLFQLLSTICRRGSIKVSVTLTFEIATTTCQLLFRDTGLVSEIQITES